MSIDPKTLSVYRRPRIVTLTGFWLATAGAGWVAADHLGPPPTVPTCDGQLMTRGDECATVPVGTDVSGYQNVLGGDDYDTMLALDQQSYLDWRWGALVVTAMILLLAVVMTVRVLAVRRSVTLPEPTGAASWHASPTTGSLSGVLGAVLAGALATTMVRYADTDDFLTADLSVPLQWIFGGLLLLGFLVLYFPGIAHPARLVRTDDTGLVLLTGFRTTSVRWAEITAVTPLTNWPITVIANGRNHTLTKELSDNATLTRRLQQAVPNTIAPR